MRVVAGLLLVLLVASGAVAWECLTVCPDDNADGQCPPTCSYCTCCSHLQAPGLLADSGSTPVLVFGRQEAVRAGEPSSGTSPDILHVPRLHGSAPA